MASALMRIRLPGTVEKAAQRAWENANAFPTFPQFDGDGTILVCGGVRESSSARCHSCPPRTLLRWSDERFGRTLCASSTHRSLSASLAIPYGQARLFS